MEIVATHKSATSPTGASFYIEQCSFKPGVQMGLEVVDIEPDKISNWPMVYILTNRDIAYVGQTTSINTRINQHSANPEKRDFNTVNIIFNEEFNASVITDYEHRLIEYMHADAQFTLTNKNDGMVNTNYFAKEAYDEMFNDLWKELQKINLVKHEIAEIEESEVFRYSPFKGLTPDQKIALDKIMRVISHDYNQSKPVVVEGMPGTGKTILAIYLLKLLRDNPEFENCNIKIVEPVTSLRKTLQQSLSNVSGLSKDDVIAPTDLVKPIINLRSDAKKPFDILLVDEAHKLKRRVNLGTQFAHYDRVNRELGLPKGSTQLEWVLSQAKLPVFFYDPLQSIGPSCVNASSISEALGTALDQPIRLDSQMRVKGGNSYLNYIRNILDGVQIGKQSFEQYDLVFHNNFQHFMQEFEKHHREYNLSRVLAGYAWKWQSKNNPHTYDIVIDDVGLKWNCTYDNWVVKGENNSEIAHEVGCIHSIQGYDLNYAFVIIGDDLKLSDEGVPESNKNGYFDRNGFATASKNELDRYIKNIYYVLLTRGIRGTHIYVKNPHLRKYFAQYFRR